MLEHAPGEGTVRATALQREIDALDGLAARRIAGEARQHRLDNFLHRHARLTARARWLQVETSSRSRSFVGA
jgi:hypothetical protein